MNDAIDTYLDELAGRVQPGGARLRRLLAECEGHLRESAAALQRQGLSEPVAAQEAVARFGPVEVAAVRATPTLAGLFADVARTAWLWSGLGLLAIGASGGLAWLIRVAAGPRFLAGDSFGVTYTRARCADFVEYFPHASSCAAAAALHHSDEVVSTRLAAGVLGLVVVGAYAWALRRRRRRPDRGPEQRPASVLPPALVPVTAAVLFTVAAGLLLLDGVGLWVGEATHGEPVAGVGDPVSAGVVAAVVAVVCGVSAVRRLVGSGPARGA